MKLFSPTHFENRAGRGSVLIIVLWIAIGLVSIALFFANSMTYELRASDNRVSGLAGNQTIEGAARYVSYVLGNYATNGAVPVNTQFACENIPVGDAHFWIIGRDPSDTPSSDPYFGLIDEASKLNLNYAGTNALSYLPNMTIDLADAIVDWRSTNGLGTMSLNYNALGYQDKHAPFETVDELRLVYGATMDLLVGNDFNLNGVLDANENTNGASEIQPGLFEYCTVYTREPNFHSDGSSLTNVNTSAQLRALLQSQFGSGRANQIMSRISTGTTFSSVLQFYLASGLSSSDFAQIINNVTASSATYIRGRVNINTASGTVLTALFMGIGIDQSTANSAAQNIINYRQQNSGNANMNSVAWIADALGNNNSIVRTLARGDYITTKSFQFTADIAAVGPFGRGYQRVKFIFDTSDGTPKIIYRQDLTGLGWALGEKARDTSLANNSTQ